MAGAVSHLFLPGWGAPGRLYELPRAWTALEPPPFASTRALDGYREWLLGDLRARRGRLVLGGHSMGAALALLAASELPERIERLVLVSPAGLPLRKPMWRSAADCLGQLASGLYPRDEALRALTAFGRAPRAALRIAAAVRRLDLSAEMRLVRAAGIPVTVLGCTTDTLTTARSCRRMAELLGAEYRELALPGGHVWMLAARGRLAAELL